MKTSIFEDNKNVIATNSNVADFIGQIVSFNNSLKLYHWHVTGQASYAHHIAIDQALTDLFAVTDRLVETSYALLGNLNIQVPQTSTPEGVVKCVEDFFSYTEAGRVLFPYAFTQAIIDDYQEALQQLLYRLKRLQ